MNCQIKEARVSWKLLYDDAMGLYYLWYNFFFSSDSIFIGPSYVTIKKIHIWVSKYLLVKYLSIERELQYVQTPQKMLLPLG